VQDESTNNRRRSWWARFGLWLLHEIKIVWLFTLYFAIAFSLLMLLKRLTLAQYEIGFKGLGLAVLGALLVAKVVAVLEKVPLGPWVRRRPAAIDVVVRTVLYTLGVFLVLVVEKGFESREEAGGFVPAVVRAFENRDRHRVWAVTIGVGGTLLIFNIMSVLRRRLGPWGLSKLFFATRLEEVEALPPESSTKEETAEMAVH
jgi:hypothetical protein